jgi:hypothetical protein
MLESEHFYFPPHDNSQASEYRAGHSVYHTVVIICDKQMHKKL